MRLDGLLITSPARTIADMAGLHRGREMRRIVERAQDVRRFHPHLIHRCLANRPAARGRRQLLDLLAVLAPDRDNARSHLERLFLRLIREEGLPTPQVNVRIAGRERDFVWPEHRLVVETDGYTFHSSPKAFARDRRRDREIVAAGWRPARFTYEEIAFEPPSVGTELGGLLGLCQGQ